MRNSHRKIHLIALLVFVFIQIGLCGEDNTNDNAEHIPAYSSLELIKNSLTSDFDIPVKENSKIVHLKCGSEIIYVCPGETGDELSYLEKNFKQFSFCLYIKKRSHTLETVNCEHEVKPIFWRMKDHELLCGKDKRGIRYTYAYENENIRDIKTNWAEIYTVCVLSNRQPIYVKYHVSVPYDSSKQNKITAEEGLKKPSTSVDDNPCESNATPSYESGSEYSIVTDDLESNKQGTEQDDAEDETEYKLSTETYGTEEAKLNFTAVDGIYKAYKQINSGEQFVQGADDRLIPQMLVSPKHLKPEFAKDAPYNYVNANPMWKSLRKKWARVDDMIKIIGQDRPNSIIVYAGTYETLKINDKDFVMKNQDNVQIKVPLVWWKLLMTKEGNKSIILAMQNTPTNYEQWTEKLCDQSICDLYGWGDVNEENGQQTIYCCPFTEDKKTSLNLEEEDIKVSGIFTLKRG